MQLFLQRIIRLSEQCFLFLDSIYNKSRNISQVYRGWLHSLGTRSAVDLKRYFNISQVYRGLLHSLGTRSAVDILKVFSTNNYRTRLAKCHRYGRYICVEKLESWGKKCGKTRSFAQLSALGINFSDYREVVYFTEFSAVVLQK